MRNEKALKELSLNSCVASRNPLIREANLKRLQFTREHKDWTLAQSKKVVWFDETRFAPFQKDGGYWV